MVALLLPLGGSPPDFVRQPTSFHLLAQMKGGKAKCLNASDTTELHGWKENAVDAEHSRLQHRVGHLTGEKNHV